jgi:hypothetical protein
MHRKGDNVWVLESLDKIICTLATFSVESSSSAMMLKRKQLSRLEPFTENRERIAIFAKR